MIRIRSLINPACNYSRCGCSAVIFVLVALWSAAYRQAILVDLELFAIAVQHVAVGGAKGYGTGAPFCPLHILARRSYSGARYRNECTVAQFFY
jgi:hypothetical protein